MLRVKNPDEFTQKTFRQVLEKSYFVPDVSKHLGISDKSLYYWVSKQGGIILWFFFDQKVFRL